MMEWGTRSQKSGGSTLRSRITHHVSRFTFHSSLVFVIYLLTALAFTWPLATRVSDTILGGGGDGWQETWEMWWMNRAIQAGSTPYHFSTLYAPDGATNFLHSLNPI